MTRALVEPAENTLFTILAVLAAIAWLILTVLTVGFVWMFIGFGFLFYLFAQSRFISYFRGTGALVTAEQFPDLYQAYEECCAELKMKNRPDMYLMHMDGIFNAFATRFMRKHYVILLSDIVDALDSKPEAVKFYIGHELGHVKRNHLMTGFWLAPVSWLPLIGPGYSRACELTCDRHGQACCTDESSAIAAMSALAVGAKRWKTINVDAYLEQKNATSGFWMSFHEVTGTYPWLVRRIAYLHEDSKKSRMPSLHPFAWLLGIFVPKMSIMTIIILYLLFFMSFGAMSGIKEFKESMGMLGDPSAFEYEYDYEDEYNFEDEDVYPYESSAPEPTDMDIKDLQNQIKQNREIYDPNAEFD